MSLYTYLRNQGLVKFVKISYHASIVVKTFCYLNTAGLV